MNNNVMETIKDNITDKEILINEDIFTDDDISTEEILDEVINFESHLRNLVLEREHLSKIIKDVKYATEQGHWIRIETPQATYSSLTKYSSTVNFADGILKIAQDRVTEIDRYFKKIKMAVDSI